MLYWAESGHVSRMALDGSSSVVVLASNNVGHPSGLTINYVTNRLFWADPVMGTIEYSRLDGSGRTELLSGESSSPFKIDVMGGFVVWNSLGAANFHFVDISLGDYEDLVVTQPTGGSNPVYGFVVVSDRRRPTPGEWL